MDFLNFFGYANEVTKKLIIIGGGNVGLFLAQSIEKHYNNIDIKIVEKDEHRAEYISQYLNNTVIINGDGLSSDVLLEAGIDDVNAVISVTQDDKVNILSSILSKKLGAKRSLCLTNSSMFANLVTSLGVDAVINPRSVTTSKLMEHIMYPKVEKIYSMGEQLGELFQIKAIHTSRLIGKNVREIFSKMNITIVAITREENSMITNNDIIIQNDDTLLLMLPGEEARKVYSILGLV